MNDATARGSEWQPTASLEVAQCRARMLAAARRFFDEHGVLEVTTPVLADAAVSDPQIESISARLAAAPGRDFFLQTSPEFAMKRLLAAGWPDIYQLSTVFRDAEVGPRHQPEFTMVEWYRRGFSLREMQAHTAQFIGSLLDALPQPLAVRNCSYVEAFRQHAGVDPLADPLDRIQAACNADAGLVNALGERRDDWLDLLLTTRVAPAFEPGCLTVLHHYPASQAALARRCPDNPQLADRFEIFYGELELANGYYELADAAEQRARIDADQQSRRERGLPLRPVDERLLAALDAGLPACCGVAVGFDRLVMINTGTRHLRDVQAFTTLPDNR